MAIQNEPTRIQIPFADSGTKNVIPDTNSTPSASQAASWTDGFPAQCSLPLSAGGIPPARADFNGVFNTMTQSIRFGQEGGVWTWDATVDYGTNRMVLGSDNKVYWSVAQSGPNVGGAQDPTTDTGVYWSTMPMLTPPLADDSSKVATTEWVRDLATASVYVNPAGSDSNDGLSVSSPVKTFAKALDIASASPASKGIFTTIVVAGGSYTENIVVGNRRHVTLNCSGNVSITGTVTIHNSSRVLIANNSYNFSIVGNLYISIGSSVYVDKDLTVTSTSNTAIEISGKSHLYVYAALTANISGSGTSGITVITQSELLAAYVYVVGSNNAASGFSARYSSLANITGDLSVTGSFDSSPTVYLDGNSTVHIVGKTTIEGPSSSFSINLDHNSVAVFNGVIEITAKASSNVVYIFNNSVFLAASTLKITSTGTPARFLNCAYGGMARLQGLNFSGTVSNAVVNAMYSSFIDIPAAATVTGTVTGKRYSVSALSMIAVNGSGANRIPGSTAGTVDATTYGVYA